MIVAVEYMIFAVEYVQGCPQQTAKSDVGYDVMSAVNHLDVVNSAMPAVDHGVEVA